MDAGQTARQGKKTEPAPTARREEKERPAKDLAGLSNYW
jgi:hypothetical protein